MNKAILTAALFLSALLWGAPVPADVLLIEKIHALQDAQVPESGLSMDQVEARYGAPEISVPAIGDPPITRWIYPTFSVFFEYQYVIDSVVHPQVAGLNDPDS